MIARPFIVGVARSGTTLLRSMLDRHPMLCILPETHFVPLLIDAFKRAPLSRDEFLEKITTFFTWPDFRIDANELGRALSHSSEFNLTTGLREFYGLYAQMHGKTGWGDKTPTYSSHLLAISQTLPEARFVHLIRDGRAIASSRRQLNFGPGPSISAQARDWVSK